MPKTILLTVAASLAACAAGPKQLVVKQYGDRWVRGVDPDGTITETLESEETVYEIGSDGVVIQAGAVSGFGDVVLSKAGELRIDGVVHARLDDAGRLELPNWPDLALAIRADAALVRGDGTVLAEFNEYGEVVVPAGDDKSSAIAYGDRAARRDLMVLWSGLRSARAPRPVRPRTPPGPPLEIRRLFNTSRLSCDGTYHADGDVARGAHGLVWARDGSPAVGASVTLRFPDNLLAYTTTTDASGCYIISTVGPGSARIEIEYQGSTAAEAIPIELGGLVRVDASVPGE